MTYFLMQLIIVMLTPNINPQLRVKTRQTSLQKLLWLILLDRVPFFNVFIYFLRIDLLQISNQLSFNW